MWLIKDTLKVAVTAVFPVTVTVHAPLPLHAPDHPLNVDPVTAAAVRVTDVPAPNDALQVVPQLMPEGLLVTVPVPVPARVTVSAGPLKVAVTEALLVKLMVQVVVPVQAPDHPPKLDPALGVAVKVTEVPLLKTALQVAPQLMPAGLLVTVPLPFPERATVSEGDEDAEAKAAVTLAFAVKSTLHVPVPLHAPLQPAKVEFAAGVAVSVTVLPELNVAWHVVPQLMPDGSLVTVPLPVPERLRSNKGELENVADTVMLEFRVRVQDLEPLHAPPQFTNVNPALGAAVNVTTVPPGKLPVHVGPQLIPLGLLVTVPLPLA